MGLIKNIVHITLLNVERSRTIKDTFSSGMYSYIYFTPEEFLKSICELYYDL